MLKALSGNVLKNESIKLSSTAILTTLASLLCMISLMKWYFLSMYLSLLWLLGSLEFVTSPLLSQYNVIGLFMSGTTLRSVYNFLSQTNSLASSQAAIYLASMVESAMLDYLTLLQITIAPLRVCIESDVDFHISFSHWKSKSI